MQTVSKPNSGLTWTVSLAFVLCSAFVCRAQTPAKPLSPSESRSRLIANALEQTKVTDKYDASYIRLKYPGGDVPLDRGVCTDVLVRAFRAAGIDLQKAVHEDVAANFSSYPHAKGQTGADANIDHRRVRMLMTYFHRQTKAVPITPTSKDYRPGDIVAWDLGGNLTHIGIVSDEKDAWIGRYKVIHNIGRGTRLEDVLFDWKIIGHYRYF